MMNVIAKWIISALVLVGTLALLWPSEAGSPEEKAALAEGRTIITYWDRHTGHEFDARVVLIEEFNRSQNEVYVRCLPIGSRIEKLLTAISGGAPPDVCSLETATLATLGSEGCFTPLDDFMREIPYLNEDRFFHHVWEMVAFAGHVWAIPTTTDSTCLLWNKNLFRRAGLDPERPPRTIQELEEFAAKLTVRDSNGYVEQIGFLPWLPWDVTHLWGCIFGGKWYDPETRRMICGADPGIIASLAWQQSFAIDPRGGPRTGYAIDPQKISAIPGGGFGEYQSASNPFYTGKVAMIVEGEWQVEFTSKYAPDLDWGVAPIPQPEGVTPVSYSPNAVVDAIPLGSRHVEAAKTFLKWFYSPRPDGGTSPASDYAFSIRNIPTRREEAMQDRFMKDPKFSIFVNELLTKPAEPFPVIASAQFLTDNMERQRGYVTLYKTTPEAAAMALERQTNAELDRIDRVHGRHGS